MIWVGAMTDANNVKDAAEAVRGARKGSVRLAEKSPGRTGSVDGRGEGGGVSDLGRTFLTDKV